MVDFKKLLSGCRRRNAFKRLVTRKLDDRPLLAVDTETTGLDIWHGCKPFYVSTCDEDGNQCSWEWPVNLYTREPSIPAGDIKELRAHLRGKRLVFHNAKFDIRALASIGVDVIALVGWDYIEDTILSTHILGSGEPMGLKDQCVLHCDIGTEDEDELKLIVAEARKLAQKVNRVREKQGLLPIRIAGPYDPHSPSLGQRPNAGWGVMDYWLPAAMAAARLTTTYKKQIVPLLPEKEAERFRVALGMYANLDTVRTMALYKLHQTAMNDFDDFERYEVRRSLLEVTYHAEDRGIAVNTDRIREQSVTFENRTKEALAEMQAVCNIDNPGIYPQMADALFNQLKLPTLKMGKPNKAGVSSPSTDKDVIAELLDMVEPKSPAFRFLNNVTRQRKGEKLGEYLDSYQRSSVPLTRRLPYVSSPFHPVAYQRALYRLLHVWFNITGTATTRFSSTNPNAQNVSKQEEWNLRYCFNPLPGRWWLSLDYHNIEMRIFAYCSGDKELIAAFERGESVHLIFAKLLFPKEYAECERRGWDFSEKYKATLYQWVKNGNFSLIYGAGQRRADTTYHCPGAYKLIRKRMPTIDRFMSAKHDEALEQGYITTLGSYRLDVSTHEPHKAVNYFVQGSAGWIICEAMVECYSLLKEHPDSHLLIQVHDELDFDVPASPRSLQLANLLKTAMERPGERYSIPTRVDVGIVKDNWSKEEKVALPA